MAYSQPTKEGEAKQTQLPPTPPKEPSKFAPKPEARTRAKQIFSENIGIDPKEVEAKLKQEGLSLSLTKIYEVRKEVKLESKPTKEEPKAQITPAKVEEPKKEEPAPSPTTTQPFQVSYDEVRTFWRNADLVISKFARTNPIDESEIKMLTDAWHPFIQKYAPYLGKYAVELGAIATVGIVYAPRIVTRRRKKRNLSRKKD
jgi:hypothetical protein